MAYDRLTATQEKALRYIEQSLKNDGMAPTLRELCQYMGYRAVGSAQDLVKSLKKKGYLKTFGRRTARSLIPQGFFTQDENAPQGSDEKVGLSDKWSPAQGGQDNTLYLPILGQVPAGHPTENAENHLGLFPVSRSVLSSAEASQGDLFVLQTKGDSMNGAGILDGDWLIVKKNAQPEHGTIVVARVDGAVTVKRLIKDRKLSWCLQPENPHFQTLVGTEQPFELVGRVVGLQRAIH